MWKSLMILVSLSQKLWDQTNFGLKTGRSKNRNVGQILDMTKNSKLNQRTKFRIRLRHDIADLEKGFKDRVQKYYLGQFLKIVV